MRGSGALGRARRSRRAQEEQEEQEEQEDESTDVHNLSSRTACQYILALAPAPPRSADKGPHGERGSHRRAMLTSRA